MVYKIGLTIAIGETTGSDEITIEFVPNCPQIAINRQFDFNNDNPLVFKDHLELHLIDFLVEKYNCDNSKAEDVSFIVKTFSERSGELMPETTLAGTNILSISKALFEPDTTYDISISDESDATVVISFKATFMRDDLIVLIAGGDREIGYNQPITLDAQRSFNPNTGGSADLGFTWFCNNIVNLRICSQAAGPRLSLQPSDLLSLQEQKNKAFPKVIEI